MAASYDERFAGMAPLRDALHLVVRFALAPLPESARILCVGVGTGLELASLARHFPTARFVGVDPSGPMLEQCRRRVDEEGLSSRCEVHEGYLDSLPDSEPFEAATSLLVSQFVVDVDARLGFFRQIARRLRPGGLLVTADLANPGSEPLWQLWLRMQADSAGLTPEEVGVRWAAQASRVAVLPPEEIERLLVSAGFEPPAQVYQGALIRGWRARRPDRPIA